MISNYILASKAWNGLANTSTIPIAVLKSEALGFLKCPAKVPFEHIVLMLCAQTYATNEIINGMEQFAWDMLQKHKYREFPDFVGWEPTTLTKRGM